MQIEIASRSYQSPGTGQLPAWPDQDKISKYQRYADSGLGYTFLKRKEYDGTVLETIVWVPKTGEALKGRM